MGIAPNADMIAIGGAYGIPIGAYGIPIGAYGIPIGAYGIPIDAIGGIGGGIGIPLET